MQESHRASADDLENAENVLSDHHHNVTTHKTGKNAFAELMKPKKPPPPVQPVRVDSASARTRFAGSDGLGPYVKDPTSFPSSRIVYYNEDVVVINDLYPKASVHLLILPRDSTKNLMQPQKAFDDLDFLAMCRREEIKVRKIVAEELRRRFGRVSETDKARLDAMDSDEPPSELPAGRDWNREIISGIHANPSMNHLHIHVLSRDMVSEPMRKTNHYLSFTTDFLVNLDQFPLSPNDHRRDYRHFPEDMLCWRCGKNYGRRIKKLKAHLGDEFEEWKKI